MHDQVAHESRHNGSIRGNFTVALLELIKEAVLTIAYNELYLVYQSGFTGIAMVLTSFESIKSISGSILTAKVITKIGFYSRLRNDTRSLKKVCYRNHVILMEGGAAHRGGSTLTAVYFPGCESLGCDIVQAERNSALILIYEDASLVLQLEAQDRVYFAVTDARVTGHGLDQDIPLGLLFGRLNIITGIPENPNFFFSNDA